MQDGFETLLEGVTEAARGALVFFFAVYIYRLWFLLRCSQLLAGELRRLFPITVAYVLWHESLPISPGHAAGPAPMPMVSRDSSQNQYNNLVSLNRIVERVSFGPQLNFPAGCRPVLALPFSIY